MARKIFVNFRVENLPQSKAFFEKLGFAFNPQFTNDHAACMIISEDGYVMLMGASLWTRFTNNKPCDTRTHTEALVALSCESRAEVDQLVALALENGGRPAMPTLDEGFMYTGSFYELDGHHWELGWMDLSTVQK